MNLAYMGQASADQLQVQGQVLCPPGIVQSSPGSLCDDQRLQSSFNAFDGLLSRPDKPLGNYYECLISTLSDCAITENFSKYKKILIESKKTEAFKGTFLRSLPKLDSRSLDALDVLGAFETLTEKELIDVTRNRHNAQARAVALQELTGRYEKNQLPVPMAVLEEACISYQDELSNTLKQYSIAIAARKNIEKTETKNAINTCAQSEIFRNLVKTKLFPVFSQISSDQTAFLTKNPLASQAEHLANSNPALLSAWNFYLSQVAENNLLNCSTLCSLASKQASWLKNVNVAQIKTMAPNYVELELASIAVNAEFLLKASDSCPEQKAELISVVKSVWLQTESESCPQYSDSISDQIEGFKVVTDNLSDKKTEERIYDDFTKSRKDSGLLYHKLFKLRMLSALKARSFDSIHQDRLNHEIAALTDDLKAIMKTAPKIEENNNGSMLNVFAAAQTEIALGQTAQSSKFLDSNGNLTPVTYHFSWHDKGIGMQPERNTGARRIAVALALFEGAKMSADNLAQEVEAYVTDSGPKLRMHHGRSASLKGDSKDQYTWHSPSTESAPFYFLPSLQYAAKALARLEEKDPTSPKLKALHVQLLQQLQTVMKSPTEVTTVGQGTVFDSPTFQPFWQAFAGLTEVELMKGCNR